MTREFKRSGRRADRLAMRNLVLSIIVALFGAAILFNGLLGGRETSDGAYGNGQRAALAIAVVMVVLGARGVIKGLRAGG